MEGLLKVTPNKERVRSILKLVDVTLEMIDSLDHKKFITLITRDYYDIIRELITALLLLDGFKTEGEGAHKKLIEYLSIAYKNDFKRHEIILLEDLREKRNKISYEGLFVTENYLISREQEIKSIISMLKETINKKL